VPGHEEIELALVKLYRATGTAKYLQTGSGSSPSAASRTRTCRRTRRRRSRCTTIVPTAGPGAGRRAGSRGRPRVRAMYLYEAVTDVAALTGNDAFARAADRLWQDVVSKRCI